MTNELSKWTKAEQAAGQAEAKVWNQFFKTSDEAGIERFGEIEESARVLEVQDKHESELLDLDNVMGIAPTLKMKGGKPTKQWALTILVEKKQPLNKVSKGSRVPSSIDKVPTDVIEVGKIEAQLFTARVRPALPGYSIGHHNITAGTFGCVVRDIPRYRNILHFQLHYGWKGTPYGGLGNALIYPLG